MNSLRLPRSHRELHSILLWAAVPRRLSCEPWPRSVVAVPAEAVSVRCWTPAVPTAASAVDKSATWVQRHWAAVVPSQDDASALELAAAEMAQAAAQLVSLERDIITSAQEVGCYQIVPPKKWLVAHTLIASPLPALGCSSRLAELQSRWHATAFQDAPVNAAHEPLGAVRGLGCGTPPSSPPDTDTFPWARSWTRRARRSRRRRDRRLRRC